MGKGGSDATAEAIEANKALVGRVYKEWWNANGNPGSVDEMVSPDFIGHLDGGKTRTIESLKRDIAVFQTALGGLHETVDDMIAEGDRVAVRYTLHARHTGDFYGVKPTGKTIKVSGIEIFRIADGKIVEFWHFGEPMVLS
ncbi:MAG: ester cyclase [Alphaproteobacteria bacterium]